MTGPAQKNLYLRRIYVVAGGAFSAAVLAAFFYINPAETRILPGCPFHLLTGWYCPGCGSSRALHQLLHGNIRAALGFNPLMVISLPWVAAYGIYYATAALIGKPWRGFFIKPVWVWMLLGIIMVYGILRNMPGVPFFSLAP